MDENAKVSNVVVCYDRETLNKITNCFEDITVPLYNIMKNSLFPETSHDFYNVFENVSDGISGDEAKSICDDICSDLYWYATNTTYQLYNIFNHGLEIIDEYNKTIYNTEKKIVNCFNNYSQLPKFVPFFESSSNNLMIGGDLTGLNLSIGYDQASWALNNQNSETLINEYINAEDSTIGSIWFIDKNGERQRIYDEGKTVAEICEEYGIDESALVFDIVRKSDGESQAWIGYNQLTNIPDTSELDIEPNDNDNTSEPIDDGLTDIPDTSELDIEPNDSDNTSEPIDDGLNKNTGNYVKGDTDGDGKLTYTDMLNISSAANNGGADLTEEQYKVYDYNNDGRVSGLDAQKLSESDDYEDKTVEPEETIGDGFK